MAKALDSALGWANFLPDDFPKDELGFWIDRLQALPDGTAEGCREPLRYAHERLSAVIRDHIGIDDDEPGRPSDQEGASPFMARGQPVEQAITNLLGAIAVANSEYERQADEDFVGMRSRIKSSNLNLNPKCGTIFDFASPVVVHPSRHRANMIKPFLDLGDIGAVIEGDGGGCRSQGMRAETRHLVDNTGCSTMEPDEFVDTVLIQRLLEIARCPVPHGAEEGSLEVRAVAGMQEILINALDRFGAGREKADLVAFALDSKMGGALALLTIANLECTELGATEPMEQQGREDRSIALAFKSLRIGCVEQKAGLLGREGRGGAFLDP